MSRSRIAWPSPCAGGRTATSDVEGPFVRPPELAIQSCGRTRRGRRRRRAGRRGGLPAQRVDDLLGRGRRFGEADLTARRVVRVQHPARPWCSGGRDDIAVEQPDDVLGRDAAGPEDLRWIDGAVDDRALDADRAWDRRRGSRHAPGRAARRGRRRRAPAVVGLTRPKRFADGAASPPPKRSSSSSVIGCDGTRIPTVVRPPVTTSSTRRARVRRAP